MLRVCVFVTCVSAFAPPVLAQDARAPVSIEQAVQEALSHNLALLAERSSLTVADAAMVTARLRPNPVFSGSADHLDLLGTGFSEENNGGPPEIAWRVDVPLERGRKRDARIALAAAVKSSAEAEFADALRALRQDVTLACVDLLAAQSTRALVADTLRAFEQLARVNRARVAAGSIAPSESTRSDVAMLQFRATAVRADLDVAAAAARLRVLLGRPPGEDIALTDSLASARSRETPDLEHLQSLAFDARPDLRALQLSQAKSTADLRLQEALGVIDYTVGAEYRRQQGISGRSNSLGFFFSTPLPFSNRNQGEIARATAERDQASLRIDARKAQIAADVRSAHHEYATMAALVASVEREMLSPATKARDTAAYTYQAGSTSLLELLDAQRAFNDTMQSYVDAQAGLRRAAARLNAAVGSEVAP
jgi:cobalt-zinc-cadmium efflux system outer membrane protein